MIPDPRSPLSSWTTGLLSAGRIVFDRDEAMREIGVGHGAFLDAAQRLQRREHLISPRRGFYVIVPPQFLAWGAPPPSWYIDDLMRFEGRPYYAGLLKAAELHGATHQAVMEFQVVTGKRLPGIRAGRTVIAFHYRRNMAQVAAGMEDRKTDTGCMKVSSPELTALDLLRYPRAAGGLDNVATVLTDLGGRLDPEKLATLSKVFERPVVQTPRTSARATRLRGSDRSVARRPAQMGDRLGRTRPRGSARSEFRAGAGRARQAVARCRTPRPGGQFLK